jgi:hypothetical protein
VDFVVVLVVLVLVVLVVSAPLRRGRAEEDVDAQREELEAERDAKYGEIRDAELDRRTGKLSDADWRAIDRTLRREAIEILRRLDELPGRDGPARQADGDERPAGDAAAPAPEPTPPERFGR